MASTLAYAPDRRNTMQAILWGVLLAVVGLRALVDHEIGSIGRPLLGPEQTHGTLHYRLPAHWLVSVRARPNPMIVVLAAETRPNATSVAPTVIAIYRHRVARMMTVGEYMDG